VSLLQIGEVRAVISTGLSDADLQDAIDREEVALTNEIGALVGERIVTLNPFDFNAPLWLDRPASAVVVTDNAVTADVRVLGNYAVERATGSWYGPVEITYIPTDELAVKRVLLGLLKLSLDDIQSGAMEFEQIGSYSYRMSNAERLTGQRQSLVDSLRSRRPDLSSVSLRSSLWTRPVNTLPTP
jgi:hypothetical protein